jgi:hypothetical protein
VTATATTLGQGQLGANTGILMTPVAAGPVVLTNVLFANTNSAVETIVVYLVRSGGNPGPANAAIPGQVLAPNQTYVAPELCGRVLNTGDALYGKSTDGSVVSFWIDGAAFS